MMRRAASRLRSDDRAADRSDAAAAGPVDPDAEGRTGVPALATGDAAARMIRRAAAALSSDAPRRGSATGVPGDDAIPAGTIPGESRRPRGVPGVPGVPGASARAGAGERGGRRASENAAAASAESDNHERT